MSGIFSVDEFGASPDQPGDSTLAIQKAINAAISAGPGSVVLLKPGTYRVGVAGSQACCFNIQNAKGLSIHGEQAEIIVTNPLASLFSWENCQECSIRGISIDYDPLPFTQGTLLAVNSAQGTFDLKIDPGYPLLDEPWFVNTKFGNESCFSFGITCARDKGSVKPNVRDHTIIKSWSRLQENCYRLTVTPRYISTTKQMEPQDRFVYLARPVYQIVLSFRKNKKATVEDVQVRSSPGEVVKSVDSEALTVRRLSVTFPSGNTRLITSNGNAVRSMQDRIGPMIEDCFFEGMADDAIDILTVPHVISNVKSPSEILIGGEFPIYKGDLVEVVDPKTGLLKGKTSVAQVVCSGSGYQVTLAGPIQGIRGGKNPSEADLVHNLSACANGVVIRNNKIQNHRRHGILFQGSGGRVENNLIKNNSGQGVVITNMPNWPNGIFVKEIRIRNNKIEGGNYSAWHYIGAIQVRANKIGYQLADGFAHSRIEIEGNQIKNWYRTGIYVGSAREVKIRGNLLECDRPAPEPQEDSHGILLEKCTEIQLEDTKIDAPQRKLRSGICICESVPADGLSVARSAFNLCAGTREILDLRRKSSRDAF